MSKSPEQFYDDLAESYSFIYPDWQKAVKRQSLIIDKIINQPGATLLDCSCGIGTQAIGLALKGYKVHATDISSKEIENAKQSAIDMKANLSFGIADFRTLDKQVDGKYNVVISFDNSLPHLLSDSELTTALQAMHNKLEKEGKIFISVRDYDLLLAEKPTSTLPQITKEENGEKIYFQTWEWDKELPIYKTNIFILILENGSWKVSNSSTMYRALKRKELTKLLEDTGYVDIKWLEPKQTGYHQPIVEARKN